MTYRIVMTSVDGDRKFVEHELLCDEMGFLLDLGREWEDKREGNDYELYTKRGSKWELYEFAH